MVVAVPELDKDALLGEAVGAASPYLEGQPRTREVATVLLAVTLDALLRRAPNLEDRLIETIERLDLPLQLGLGLRTRRTVLELAGLFEGLLSRTTWDASDGERLGHLFEGGLGAGLRKRLGQYYTPQRIVDFLLDRALAKCDGSGSPFRVIDPACGAGHFLAAVAERLVKTLSQGHATRPEVVAGVFERHIFGVDIDPLAAEIARIRLGLVALRLGCADPVRPRILNGDALKRGLPGLESPFQAVVGNPPYGAELTPVERAYAAREYELGKGRYDSTALFVERGLELLAPGGRLGLVVPHGFTRTGAYAPCRKLLERKTALVALLDAGQAFPGVNLEAVAFVAEKEGRARKVELASMRSGAVEVLGVQEAAFFVGRPTLPIYVPSEAGRIVQKLERLGTSLEDLAKIRRGSPVSARDPAIGPVGPGIRVVRGRDISRYAPLEGAPLLILARPDPLFERATLTEERIGYQNIASAVVATLLPAATLPLDTVNVLEPRKSWDALALLGYLNSRLAEFYFRVAITNMAQLTVHLDAPTIGSLPILATIPGAAPLAKALLAAIGAGASAGTVDETARALDDLVMSAADLTGSERTLVLSRTRPILARSWRGRAAVGKILPSG